MSDEREELEGTALVRNAADAGQVRAARKKESQALRRERDQMRAVLATDAGRAVLWRLLDHCSAFETALGATDAITNFNIGRQDVGHFLYAQITEANPEAFIAMMRANIKESTE